MKKTYAPPGPGTWMLDASHCERPHSGYMAKIFPPLYTGGMRASMERYGSLLDTLECALVDGFAYIAPRPLGAPPDARGTPPKFVFKLLVALHPALRRRVKRAERALAEKVWREDAREYLEVTGPKTRERLRELQAAPIEDLDDAGALAHLAAVRDLVEEDMFDHFRVGGACMLPVGDFAAHVIDWTGCQPTEAVALLTGHSPQSLDAVDAIDRVVAAIRDDASRRALLDGSDAAAVLAALRTAPDPLGEAAREWLALVEHRILTGHDPAELRGIEIPEQLVRALRARLDAPPQADAAAEVEAKRAALRARVPEAHRAEFDALLEEARAVHPLRDGRSSVDYWALGILRRALLEVGRRLVAKKKIEAAEHALDLEHAEIDALLRGGASPTKADAAARFRARQDRTCADMPDFLGPAPGKPPPSDWLPPAARRIARAMDIYLSAAFTEADVAKPTANAEVNGIAASPGRCVGVARVVNTAADFGRVQKGDVLVARVTSPAYNVILPLLRGIVTERGGLLSHPAIVSREFGIPGVVGARGVLDAVRDGARVEVDGDAGVVRVLA